MLKVVIHASYGGFGLSEAARERLEAEGFDTRESWEYIHRHDPRLVRVVEEMGPAAHPSGGPLVVKEIEGNRYYITEYDGWESIVTPQDVERRWIVVG